jgi:hypothetical protein
MIKDVHVAIGDQLFEHEDGSAFGAVVAVRAHDLSVDIEGFGITLLPAAAVRSVHDGKLIIDTSRLPPDVQRMIAHAHDRETE